MAESKNNNFEPDWKTFWPGEITFCAAASHGYTITCKSESSGSVSKDDDPFEAELQVDTEISQLGPATNLDRLIWEKVVTQQKADACETLNLWTTDTKFTLFLFYKLGDSNPKCTGFQCEYFPSDPQSTFNAHAVYWMNVAKDCWDLTSDPEAFKQAVRRNWKKGADWATLTKVGENGTQGDTKLCEALIQSSLDEKDSALQSLIARQAYQHRSSLVVWNFFELKNAGGSGTKNGNSKTFTRHHAFAFDSARSLFQTVPVPDKFFFASPEEEESWCGQIKEWANSNSNLDKTKNRAARLYGRCTAHLSSRVARGNPMQRNFLTLSAMLADRSLKRALVTGEPGTGKEDFAKALYYGRGSSKNKGTQFVTVTAPELEATQSGSNVRFRLDRWSGGAGGAGRLDSAPSGPVEVLRSKLRDVSGALPDTAWVFIDELNKASPKLLGGLLRALEQSEQTLGLKSEATFVLAASEHIDKLGQIPPQDFWTRVNHQLRVAHPLSHVSLSDAEGFLEAYFFTIWWRCLNKILEDVDKSAAGERDRLIRQLFLKETKRWSPSPRDVLKDTIEIPRSELCELVRDEFIRTLVPFVTRDTLSVRGAFSIVQQVFSRVVFDARMRRPPEEHKYRDQIGRLVNEAIQDVLAILNAARHTPAHTRGSSKED